jgi:transcriptional regulator NrdR
MKCPFCGGLDNKVTDSRLSQGDEVIRRRRECEGCARRFTTYERIELVLPMVIKKDGRREAFDRLKVMAGLRRACEKARSRPRRSTPWSIRSSARWPSRARRKSSPRWWANS